jgi:hypothetical protein
VLDGLPEGNPLFLEGKLAEVDVRTGFRGDGAFGALLERFLDEGHVPIPSQCESGSMNLKVSSPGNRLANSMHVVI